MTTRRCFYDGVFCSGKTLLVRVGESTDYCPACYVATKIRCEGPFPNLIKPGTRKLTAEGTRWRGTHNAHA